MACNLCGSESSFELFAAGVAQVHRIVQCSECGLMYADPPGSPEHRDIESWPDDPAWDIERERPQRFEKERLQVRDYRRTRERLLRLHPRRGTLVEVGASLGFLLAAFRDDGWQVKGIEPDVNGCKYARQRLGLDVFHGVLEAANLPDASADVVVMLHVIEHMPDPEATLREVWRILKPGGHLVLETPRYDSLMFRLLGRRERSIRCHGHVFFFTTSTLRRACELAGFVVQETKYPGRSLTLDRLVYNLSVMARGGRFQPVDASRRAGLQRFAVRLNLRDVQRVIAAKQLEARAGTP